MKKLWIYNDCPRGGTVDLVVTDQPEKRVIERSTAYLLPADHVRLRVGGVTYNLNVVEGNDGEGRKKRGR